MEQDILLTHGPIKSIVSDNGTEFVNGIIDNLSEKWKFWHVTSSPYYPQSNGLQERTNGTVILKLAKLYYEEKEDGKNYSHMLYLDIILHLKKGWDFHLLK